MAMNRTDRQDYRLPCGRDVEQVWERLDEAVGRRSDDHESGCPYCTATRESLTVLRRLTGELTMDAAEPSLGLTGRIMAAVRADVRRRDMLPLPTPEPGGVLMSQHAMAAMLRFAADTVEGVHARHCLIRPTNDPDFAIEVELTIAVSVRDFAATALDEVRDRVTAAAGARIGVRLARLDLTLDDLYDI